MVVLFMGVEDGQEGGIDLREEVVDQVVEDFQEEVEANFWLEVHVCLLLFLK
jgi:hypothetical protein